MLGSEGEFWGQFRGGKASIGYRREIRKGAVSRRCHDTVCDPSCVHRQVQKPWIAGGTRGAESLPAALFAPVLSPVEPWSVRTIAPQGRPQAKTFPVAVLRDARFARSSGRGLNAWLACAKTPSALILRSMRAPRAHASRRMAAGEGRAEPCLSAWLGAHGCLSPQLGIHDRNRCAKA